MSNREQLDILWLAAELAVSTGKPLVPDLGKRMQAAATELATRKDPTLRSYERWFENLPAAPRAPALTGADRGARPRGLAGSGCAMTSVKARQQRSNDRSTAPCGSELPALDLLVRWAR
jgi:hypothetical protein